MVAVPDVPGVPPLNRFNQTVVAPATILFADAAHVLSLFQGPQWGIFDQLGGAVIVGDSVKAFRFSNEFRVSDFPVEQGGFASYNKVATPFDAQITFTKGGTVGERADFLSSVASALRSLYLFQVLTPEVAFQNVNIVHFDYDRTARRGATLLTVDVWVKEVRLAPVPQFSNTQAPDGAAQINDGTVQATPVTSIDLGKPVVIN